jgi:geranylgeranyl pyrophosphate synthase
MPAAQLIIPRPVPLPRARPPKPCFPQTLAERTQILQAARHYVAEFNPVPPMPLDELAQHAARVIELLGCAPAYRDYLAVLINNEMWRETLATVPYSRRLLLLPKCLRVEDKCPAPFDEFGLLCKQCGLCSIQDLQNEAERLGYAVLVAEGSQVVMSLIQSGRIDAIVGVSCLNVLERAFPYMESAAIPGVAIPLLQDDCHETSVDLDWVWDYIHLTSHDQTRRLDLGQLRAELSGWFVPPVLDCLMGQAEGETEQLARQWLLRAGKRWRPFLAAAAFQALRTDASKPLPDDLRRIAIAVECFHKASLIHDDIEDNDPLRYGEKTMHAEHGLAVALNVGDLLIGEGYRLLALCAAAPEHKAHMLLAAAEGQRQLCRGQGAELWWAQSPGPLSTLQVLDVFRRKTAPAFEVALKLGALCAQADREQQAGQKPSPERRPRESPANAAYTDIARVLSAYSEALGIAYQIRDDLSDLDAEGEGNDIQGLRPSLLLAVACERARGPQKAQLESLWGRPPESRLSAGQVVALYRELKADQRARTLLETYKQEAIRSLRDLENPNLKGLLRRVIGKIFNEPEIQAWCKDFEALNAQKPAPAA